MCAINCFKNEVILKDNVKKYLKVCVDEFENIKAMLIAMFKTRFLNLIKYAYL
jgi:hypothetical protein